MLSLESIVAINDKATRTARAEGLTPYVAECNGDDGISKAPKLGYFLPKGWEYIQEFFVDSSGLGRSNEPALTFEQLLGKVKAGYGYAIGKEGQFQLYIREYRRK